MKREDPGSTQLYCPRCGIALQREQNVLCCSQCKKQYRIIDGVPCFIDETFYWGEIPQREMQKINERIKVEYWRKVLSESSSERVQKKRYFIENLSRANFHFLSQLPSDSRVLDVGSGLGTISESLAHYYDNVFSIEPVLERVAFSLTRFKQEHINNITLIQTDLAHLPFAEGTFDLIVLNGVLEWIAQYERSGAPQSVQLKTLRNLNRLLKPGGILYIGVENRFGFPYFRGCLDHSYLPFTSLMPRFLADMITRKKKGYPYRTYTYSWKGYSNLISKAGFRNLNFYYPHPGYNNQRQIIPLASKMLNVYFSLVCKISSNVKRKAKRILALSGAFNWIAPCYLIFSQKKGLKRRSELEGIVRRAIERTQYQQHAGKYSFIINNTSKSHVTALVFIKLYDHPLLVMKIPIKHEYNDLVVHEYRSIERMRALFPGHMKRTLPKPILLDDAEGKPVSLMGYLKGKQIAAPLNLDGLSLEIDRVTKWLGTFHQLLGGEKARFDDELADELINGPLERFAKEQDLTIHEKFRKWKDAKTMYLKKRMNAFSPQHGDFWHGNIIRNGDAIGVFDWEFFGIIKLPLFDFFHFLTMIITSPVYFGKNRKKNFSNLFSSNSMSDVMQKKTLAFANEMGIDKEAVSFLYFLYLINFYDKIGRKFLGREIKDEMVYLVKEFMRLREHFAIGD